MGETSPKVTEVLQVRCLRGISTKDFVLALAEFFGNKRGAERVNGAAADRGAGRGAGDVQPARPEPLRELLEQLP